MLRRLILIFGLMLCLVPVCVKGDCTMEQYNYEEYEKLYLRMIETYPDPDNPKFAGYPEAGRALYIVMYFDMEIQNGGLCQFFWNCGTEYARLLPDALRKTGFNDVAELYDSFIRNNNITLETIGSYRERDPEMSEAYYWYDYSAFDEPYITIWEETNINQRFLDYAKQHPEIGDK